MFASHSSHKEPTELISGKCGEVGEAGEVNDLQDGPAPAIGFAACHGHGAEALHGEQ